MAERRRLSLRMDNRDLMDRVRSYYATFGEREWSRLDNPADGAIEFELTKRALTRHLVGNERALDVGGGPGRYAIWLAQRGHRVVLADLSRELLAIGRDRVRDADTAVPDPLWARAAPARLVFTQLESRT